jgi:hypothetical protein
MVETSTDNKFPARSLRGILLLVGLTAGSLGLAWLFPDATLLHYLWVAQVVPILYVVLAWWGIQKPRQDEDAL